MATEITLEGTLDRVLFHDDESAWTVARVNVAGRAGGITVVGNLVGIQPGEVLRLRGEWVTDRRFGEQFKAVSYVNLVPETLVGIEKYLGSGMVPGIGRAMAARLVERFALETLDVIENHAHRLTEVEGIGKVRSQSIRDAWLAQRDVKEVMIFLQSHGVSTGHAARIYKQYGQRALAIVREDPYRLAVEVRGIGFRTADQIAKKLGVPDEAPRRVQAGVLHALGELADAGHCLFPRAGLVEHAAAMLGVDVNLVDEAITMLAIADKPRLILDGDSVYLVELYAAEREVAMRLRAILETPTSPLAVDVPRALAWLETERGFALAEGQRAALERAITAKVLVVTGGPGTGKTTIIDGIVRILEKKGRRVVLCAPTGRAAKRMTQATGHEARTAHRLLEYQPRGSGFGRDRAHPLEADVVIVDETSMVDIVLAQHLFAAIPDRAQLVLVGDVDQLPSVGPGSVLEDVIASGAVAVARLTTIFRQAEASLIVVNAHRINAGEPPQSAEEGGDFFIVERDEPEQILATVKELVMTRVPRRFGLDAIDDVQVLTPMQKGNLGVAALNVELQALLNPPATDKVELVRGGRVLRVGDKVMQVRNNYDLDVYNGDLGRVAAIDLEERVVKVVYDEREVSYEAADVDELVLAYACSIHKSQGSEYPAVIVPLHTQHYVMLQRNLLYTAVTRGKRVVVLVGSKRAIGIATRNHSTNDRHTRLAERLRSS